MSTLRQRIYFYTRLEEIRTYLETITDLEKVIRDDKSTLNDIYSAYHDAEVYGYGVGEYLDYEIMSYDYLNEDVQYINFKNLDDIRRYRYVDNTFGYYRYDEYDNVFVEIDEDDLVEIKDNLIEMIDESRQDFNHLLESINTLDMEMTDQKIVGHHEEYDKLFLLVSATIYADNNSYKILNKIKFEGTKEELLDIVELNKI